MENFIFSPILAVVMTGVFIGFSIRIILLRKSLKIGLGNGGNKKLDYAIAAQRNFFEYGVFFLWLIFWGEILSTSIWFLIFGAGIFLLGRGVHAYAFLCDRDGTLRVKGMQGTFVGLGILMVGILWSLIFV